MRNLAIYVFVVIFFSNCTNDKKKIPKTVNADPPRSIIQLVAKFDSKEKDQEINLQYVDLFNDRQSFRISDLDTSLHNIKITSNTPIFVMDWTISQTYYILYPNEKITIEPAGDRKKYLTLHSSITNQVRKNELFFFQALALSERTEASKRVGEILGRQSRRDISTLLTLIELGKNLKNKNTDQAYQFLKKKYNSRINFLESYKRTHPISGKFHQIVSKYFQFEFENWTLDVLKHALANRNKIATELYQISQQSMKADNGEWLFIPSYQYKLKNYLTFSFLKLNITSEQDKLEFINREFTGMVRDFCAFLVFKDQPSILNSKEKTQLAATFSKSGQHYLDYINKNQNFYSNAAKQLDSKDILLQSFTGTNLDFGNLLKSLKGKVILLDFWASWCNPCKADMPFSKRLHKEFENKDVEFVYLSLDENYNNWHREAKLLGLEKNSFLVSQDYNSKLPKNLKVNSIPRYVLIDKKGVMVDLNAPRPNDPLLKKKIQGLL